jgi:hypothetical protein
MSTKKKFKTYTSPVGVAKFAWLTKADTKFNADGEYRTEVLLDPADAEGLIEAIDAAIEVQKDLVIEDLKAKGKKGKALNIKMSNAPYKDDEDAEGNDTGLISFRFKMKAKVTSKQGEVIIMSPAIFDSQNAPMSNTPIFSGSKIQVAYQIFPFYTAMAGCGVSLRLKAVRVHELVSANQDGSSYFGDGAEGGYEHEEQAQEAAATDTETDGEAPEF